MVAEAESLRDLAAAGDARAARTSTARAAKKAARREELLDAAAAAIRRDGAGVTMESIAAEAGITKPIIYKHFGHRDGLSLALAERFAADLMSEVRSNLDRDLPQRELFRATMDAYLDFVQRERRLYRFMMARVGDPLGGVTSHLGLVGHVSTRVSALLHELFDLPTDPTRPDPVEAWSYAIVGMVHLAGEWWIDNETLTRAQLVDQLDRLLWNGLAGLP